MKSIDSFFKPVSKRTLAAMQNVCKEKSRDADDRKQKEVEQNLNEIKVKIRTNFSFFYHYIYSLGLPSYSISPLRFSSRSISPLRFTPRSISLSSRSICPLNFAWRSLSQRRLPSLSIWIKHCPHQAIVRPYQVGQAVRALIQAISIGKKDKKRMQRKMMMWCGITTSRIAIKKIHLQFINRNLG